LKNRGGLLEITASYPIGEQKDFSNDMWVLGKPDFVSRDEEAQIKTVHGEKTQDSKDRKKQGVMGLFR